MTLISGIRVLDVSHVIAGPFATYQLALMGAEVIRVERPNGNDFVRTHGGTEAMRGAGLGASFVSQNAGKRCIQLDLKKPEAVYLFKRLAATADVVIENYRPGVMDRLGLGYDAIRAVKPNIVYCSLNGYGREGPLRDAPAYDHIVQGMTGIMSMTGTPDSGPLRVGLPITDYMVGTHAALAIVSALLKRQLTGEGTRLDVSMLASVLTSMGAYAVDYQTTGNQRGLEGNRPFSGSPFAGRFATKDGAVVITANTAEQAERLIAELAAPTLTPFLEAMRSGSVISESERTQAETILSAALATDSAENWERRLAAISVPAGKVRDLSEVLAHPQVEAVGCLDTVPLADGETVQVPGLGFKAAGDGPRTLPAPEVAGQSTAAVLGELGLSRSEITNLAKRGVIAGPDLEI